MMSERYMLAIWRYTRFVGLLMVPWIILILAINFYDAYKKGETLPWTQIAGGLGLILWAFLILEMGRRWSNYLAGRKICHWKRK